MDPEETQASTDADLDADRTRLDRSGPAPFPPPPSSPPTPTADTVPRRLDHYEILTRQDGSVHELGRGAMGVTYKALDTRLHVHVALKVINPTLLTLYPDALERFLREARAAARLRHPNIATVFHLGETADGACAFYAMEFIEGQTLQEHVARYGPLSATQTLDLGLEVARALVAANQQGFIHRDLKPANLMLVAEHYPSSGAPGTGGGGSTSGEARVKVIDFGLAKMTVSAGPLTHSDHFVGTPQYASPEQFHSSDASPDIRSDIYSLGATLWFVLTGRLPFAGRSMEEISVHKRKKPPVEQLAGVAPPCLAALLTSMLAVDPDDRPQTPYLLLEEIRRCREAIAPTTHLGSAVPGSFPGAPGGPAGGRNRLATAALVLVLLALAGVALVAYRQAHPGAPPPPSAAAAPPFAPPEKSVAVLPFSNLSADPSNQFFADAVQDEILINLARVADLKVISRTSVVDYRDAGSGGQPGATPRNLPKIARAVGVAHIVEGSVQRDGNQIRVSAKLIDTRTDALTWTYSDIRSLNDLFAVQAEIARTIAGQLRAKLSQEEKASIDEPPTRNLAAYKLYREASQKWNESDVDSRALFDDLTGLLRQSLALDPEFIRARVFLVNLLAFVYRGGYEETATAAENMRREVEEIARRRPDSGEAHQAAGLYEYYVRLEYERARQEFSLAARTLPNDPDVHLLLGLIGRRQNHWEEALAGIEKAAELDPANADVAWKRIVVLSGMRRYDEARRYLDAYITAHPGVVWTVHRAELAVDERADLEPVRDALKRVPAGFDPEGEMTMVRFCSGLWGRDFDGAAKALAVSPRTDFPGELPVQRYSREFMTCLLAHARGDAAGVRTHATAALPDAQARLAARPDDPARVLVMATLQAVLGNKAQALAQGRQAVALAPVEKDAFLGPHVALQFARILVWIGERDEAVRLLADLANRPEGPTYGNLRLNPDWEPLRGDKRFEATVAGRAPKK